MRLLSEVDAAAFAGFRRFRDFRRALRAGRFPQPDVELPEGPRWSDASLTRWLDASAVDGSHGRAEANVIERMRRRAEKAATPHDTRP